MTLFKISLNSIRRSLRDYTIYFFTLVIAVSVFYVFNAIGSQAAMMRISADTRRIVRLLTDLLSGLSVFVALVLGLLIVYANRFLMKRRGKEFAVYLTLGMGKLKIALILTIETLIVGVGSLAVGLTAGVFISQFMSAIVANLFEADMARFRFTVSCEALAKTAYYFGLIFLVAIVVSSFAVGRLKLIDLMQSESRSEKMRMKNPWLCSVVFLLSCVALGYAYYNVVGNSIQVAMSSNKLLITMAVGAVATFLIFWSASGMLLRIVSSFKGLYYRGLGAFTFRQISSGINTMIMSMTVICLMLFFTICALASSFAVTTFMKRNFNGLCPADCQIVTESAGFQPGEKHPEIDPVSIFEQAGCDLTGRFREYVQFRYYFDYDFTVYVFLTGKADIDRDDADHPDGQNQSILLYSVEKIVKLSDYNALMKLYGKEPMELGDNEFAVICNYQMSKETMDKALYEGREITVFGRRLRSRFSECQDGFIELSAQNINEGIFIVPDLAVKEECYAGYCFTGNYNADTKAEKAEVEAQFMEDFYKARDILSQYNNDEDGTYVSFGFLSKIQLAGSSVGIRAITTFLGLYIGLIFLVCSGVLLALKELSGSVDSIPRYRMLRKLGVDEKDISRSLLIQTGIFFLMPLLLAAIHSVFGMKFGMFILQLFGVDKMTEPVALTSLVILLIYGGYFLMTYLCSRSIIRSNR